MFAGQSVLGVSAAGLYSLVMLACLAASVYAVGSRQPVRQAAFWAGLVLLFAGLVMLRALNLEEALRQDFRTQLRMEGTYEQRRDFQRPLVAGAIIAGSPLVFFLFYKIVTSRASRRVLATYVAATAAAVMIGLLGLRIISLHQVDALLYGPLKLNWFGDIGASLTVLAAALLYVRLVRQRR